MGRSFYVPKNTGAQEELARPMAADAAGFAVWRGVADKRHCGTAESHWVTSK